ncbi:MarR family winged helix-turn-helix transcriptional regulator [Phaeacidiphilus oryzae]|uniref:MarR family winged helix-turn-helix transcriptional regulator n=1 Tax=Phaeacidiphilus oryzae TaxID=348818 RepID=UPI0006906C1C|nr:MarR family transcriptional regulator [Phaeacidiphilus oryzae]
MLRIQGAIPRQSQSRHESGNGRGSADPAVPDADLIELATAPGHLLRVFQQVHTRLWAERVTVELTAPQFSALSALAQQPGADQRTVGRLASLDKATMAEMVVRLVQRGLLLRRRDPVDGRRKLLSLSPQGATMLRQAAATVEEVQELLLAPLTEEERGRLLEALRAMAESAEESAEAGTEPGEDGREDAAVDESAMRSRTVGHLIRVAQQVHTRLWTELVPGELTAPQYAVLVALAEEPGMDQRTLGERASLDKATMAELIGRLVRRGLVLRRRDPADGRRNLLAPSPAGAELLRRVGPGVREVQERVLDGVPPSAREDAMSLLRRAARLTE